MQRVVSCAAEEEYTDTFQFQCGESVQKLPCQFFSVNLPRKSPSRGVHGLRKGQGRKMNVWKGMNFPLWRVSATGRIIFFIQKAESNYFVIFDPLNVTGMQETHFLNLQCFWFLFLRSQGCQEATRSSYTEYTESM